MVPYPNPAFSLPSQTQSLALQWPPLDHPLHPMSMAEISTVEHNVLECDRLLSFWALGDHPEPPRNVQRSVHPTYSVLCFASYSLPPFPTVASSAHPCSGAHFKQQWGKEEGGGALKAPVAASLAYLPIGENDTAPN